MGVNYRDYRGLWLVACAKAGVGARVHFCRSFGRNESFGGVMVHLHLFKTQNSNYNSDCGALYKAYMYNSYYDTLDSDNSVSAFQGI